MFFMNETLYLTSLIPFVGRKVILIFNVLPFGKWLWPNALHAMITAICKHKDGHKKGIILIGYVITQNEFLKSLYWLIWHWRFKDTLVIDLVSMRHGYISDSFSIDGLSYLAKLSASKLQIELIQNFRAVL